MLTRIADSVGQDGYPGPLAIIPRPIVYSQPTYRLQVPRNDHRTPKQAVVVCISPTSAEMLIDPALYQAFSALLKTGNRRVHGKAGASHIPR